MSEQPALYVLFHPDVGECLRPRRISSHGLTAPGLFMCPGHLMEGREGRVLVLQPKDTEAGR